MSGSNNDPAGGNVVSLKNLAASVDHDMPFGVSVRQHEGPAGAANESLSSLLSRIVVDETLPLYVAALDGSLLYHNEHYQTLDKALGEICLAAGSGSLRTGVRIPTLKPVIDDVRLGDKTVRAEEIAKIGGRERVFLGRHMPVRGDAGQIIAVAGTYEDVTLQVRGLEEIAKTQALFQDFTRASSDWFFECGADLKVSSLSDRFTAIIGQPAQMFIGAVLTQVGQTGPNMDGQDTLQASMDARKPFRDQLLTLESAQGETYKFHLSAVPVFDRRSGDFQGYRGVGMDVTERYDEAERAANSRANLEALLKELTRKNMALDDATATAQSSLRAKNEFLAAMSHELKTPLNAIIGFADTFVEESFGNLDLRYKEYAKDIRDSGRHLLGLINDILDVAVIEGGQLSLRLADSLIEDCIDKAIHMTIESARTKGLNTTALSVSGSTWVRVDPRRLLQIFVNLMSNAVKFTPKGGEIGIDFTRDDSRKTISVTIWDTGVGIPPSKLETIFDKFEQVTHGIYSRGQEGTGLGLHISRELARRMGGEISVTSVEGKGSRFTVTMPLAEDHTDASDDFI